MAQKYKFNFIKTIVTLLCLFILATIGREVFARHFFNTRLTVIPNVVNLNEKDAKRYLKEAGLNIKVTHSKTEKVPLDTVYIQFPSPGKEVKVNRTVQIWVNNGADQKVPNIVGLELLEARSQLQGQDIQIERIDYLPSNKKYNTILGVYPKPGTKLELNQKISLLVSSQKVVDPSTMPNLIGLDLKDARVLLNQIGLEINEIARKSDSTLPVNSIIATNPKFGSKISKDQKISVVINSGSPTREKKPSVEDIITRKKKKIKEKEIDKVINETMDEMDKQQKQKQKQREEKAKKPDVTQDVEQNNQEQSSEQPKNETRKQNEIIIKTEPPKRQPQQAQPEQEIQDPTGE